MSGPGADITWQKPKLRTETISPRAVRNKQAFIKRGEGVPLQGRAQTDPQPGGQRCSSPVGCREWARLDGYYCENHSQRISELGAEIAAQRANPEAQERTPPSNQRSQHD